MAENHGFRKMKVALYKDEGGLVAAGWTCDLSVAQCLTEERQTADILKSTTDVLRLLATHARVPDVA